MRRRWAALPGITAFPGLTALALSCGGSVATTAMDSGSGGIDAAADQREEVSADGPTIDAIVDAGSTKCDPQKPFGAPSTVLGPNMMQSAFAKVSDDRLQLWYTSSQNGPTDVFHSSRPSTNLPFGPGMLLFASGGSRGAATLTADALTVVYGLGPSLTLSTRANAQTPFQDGQPILASGDSFPHLVPDGSALYHTRAPMMGGPPRLFRSVRAGTFQPSSPVAGLDEIGGWGDISPATTADELAIYFGSTRPGSTGGIDVWVARRASKNAPFGKPTLVAEVSSPDFDLPSWVSPDDCELYWTRFHQNVDGGSPGMPTLLHATRAM